MGRQAAMVVTWESSVPGREGESLNTFMDWMTTMGKYAADSRIEEPEAYFKYDGSGGMGIVRGQSDTLLEIWESEEFRDIISRGQLTVQNLRTEMYAAGDSVTDMIGRYTQVATSMGYMQG